MVPLWPDNDGWRSPGHGSGDWCTMLTVDVSRTHD